MSDPDLRAELGADPPPGLLAALDAAALASLAAAVRQAKVRQREALDRAADNALSGLPAVVRKAVLRALR